jgi:hypothetical protein
MPFVPLGTIFDPEPDEAPPHGWGDQIAENLDILAALRVGGGSAGQQDSNPINTYAALPVAFTIPDPGLEVNIVANFTGVSFDFSAINIHEARMGISIDGGSSFTYGQVVTSVNGQGGSNYNRQSHACSHARMGVTPTGDIVIRVEYRATVNTGALVGDITYTVQPVTD